MKRRLVGILVALVVLGLFALAPAGASAASPWWQIVTGSRPTNLWKPSNGVIRIDTELGEVFAPETLAGKIEVNGAVVGCLGSSTGAGSFICANVIGRPTTSTAEQLQTVLEGVLGANSVEVTGGPVGGNPFVVAFLGRGAPNVVINTELLPEIFLGKAPVTVIDPGGSGRLNVTITNLGNTSVDATETPVTVVDELPEGASPGEIEGVAGIQGKAGTVHCGLEGEDVVKCTFEGTLKPYEAIELEVAVSLIGNPPAAGLPGTVTVSGGNSQPKSETQKIKVSSEPTPFGIERFSMQAEEDDGEVTSQAGSHPFQLTTTLQFNAGRMTPAPKRNDSKVEQPAQPRNVRFTLPAGLVGNATQVQTCELSQFYALRGADECPDASAIGVVALTLVGQPKTQGFLRIPFPLFNLTPAYGEPARFGFTALGAPVVIDTKVDPDNGYRIISSVANGSQVVRFLSATVVLWGRPGDPRHDSSRGWGCLNEIKAGAKCEPRPAGLGETAFLREPVACSAARPFDAEIEPWNVPLNVDISKGFDENLPPSGCNQVPFNPTIGTSATSKLAGSPSGFDFTLDMPNDGLLDKENKEAIAEGQAKRIEVTLPKGVTVNPSQGEGLVGCTPADYARETASSLPGQGCPEASKVGEVQISTPLLNEEAHGAIYVASPHDNPFGSLLGLYMVAKIPERGALIKQAGEVIPDPVTGQLTTVFDNLPQIPVSHFHLHFREGGRAPLVTPPACGTYDVVAKFTPWSAADPNNPAPNEIVERMGHFTVERGVDGGACPGGGLPPFHPGLTAGTINNAAGTYSPFDLRLTRNDGEQEFTHFSIKLPPGVIGKLAGIPVCTDAAIAAARARTGPNGGQEELEHPSCPQASQVGRTLVGAGVGASLTYVPGKVYLAGRYKGAPVSIVSITAAKVGPFDLGTVVVREALRVNPETAEVFVDAANSDPIPHIIQGIPVHARDIRVYVDRPEFVLNPTNCERTSTASTVVGSGLDFGSASDDQPVTVTSPFQAADCASLAFKPKMSFTLSGGTKRGATPALRAVVRPRKGDANFAKAQVTLPHSVFLEQAHIRTVCTRVQFSAGGGNGEQCPKASIYGRAQVVSPLLDEPLVGPVFLRSSSHPLPDMVLALHAARIDLDLVGRIDSGKGGTIRTTFDQVPDAPASKLVLEMRGGKKSLIVNSRNLCRGKHRAIAELEAQNGLERTLHPIVHARGCGGKKKSKR